MFILYGCETLKAPVQVLACNARLTDSARLSVRTTLRGPEGTTPLAGAEISINDGPVRKTPLKNMSITEGVHKLEGSLKFGNTSRYFGQKRVAISKCDQEVVLEMDEQILTGGQWRILADVRLRQNEIQSQAFSELGTGNPDGAHLLFLNARNLGLSLPELDDIRSDWEQHYRNTIEDWVAAGQLQLVERALLT